MNSSSQSPSNGSRTEVSGNTREKHRYERRQQERKARRRRELSIPRLVYDEELPVSSRREEIKQAILENQVVVLCGETGSGKSTQLPKICLELGFGVKRLIGHTQPRRIAAISIANRLAHELSQGKQRQISTEDLAGFERGDSHENGPGKGKEENDGFSLISPEKLVGYKIRFTDHTSSETCVKLMTDGILLAETQSDRFLNQYEVLIIDEAHERSLNIDFLIGILRRLADRRPDLKIIITSATIDAARFAAHFETGNRKVPILMIEGRTYPVEVLYQPIFEEEEDGEEDGNEHFEISSHGKSHSDRKKEVRVIHDGDIHQAVIQAAETLAQKGPGDILVFMPTERDIHELVKLFQGESQRQRLSLFRNENVEILPLYARLPGDQQQKIFNPSGNRRRIVIATNVAESSVTVPRIRSVIDTGTARISRYSARSKTQRLPIEPISRASADQRKGRCGRVGPGICVRLYSEEDYLSREEYTQPEIQRTNLASVILQTKILRLGRIESFPFLDMPKIASIRDGYRTLFELKALTKASPDGELTPLGQKLARLPVDPRIGRMILEAVELAKESDEAKTGGTGERLDGKRDGEAKGPEKVRNQRNLKREKRKENSVPRVNPLLEVLVIAAALEIRDPRDRPIEKQGEADTAHARFMDARSDFLSFLKLWMFYFQLKEKLSRNQLIKACRQNFISWSRMREWLDVYQQLREMVQELLKESKLPAKLLHGEIQDWVTDNKPESMEISQAKYEAVHRVLLSGLLSNLGQKTPLTQEYAVGGGGKCFLWPGSGILKQLPAGAVSGAGAAVGGLRKTAEGGVEERRENHRQKAGNKFWGRTLDADGKIIDTHGNVDPETNSSRRPEGGGTPEESNAAKKKTFPEWVMAAEMVETSKRFLRTNAVINVDWVEPMAEHLVTKSHSEPHWSKQNNDVMIYEKVSLFGLVIVPKRRVRYGLVNQEQAREMFIQQGLVEGNWRSTADFYRWNRELWFELEQIQAKLRRFDYLPGSWKLYEFYDQRIPKTVFDHTTLEKWLKSADSETLRSLEMKEEDLVSESTDRSLSERFPDTFSGEFTYAAKSVPMKKPAKSGVGGANPEPLVVSEKSEDNDEPQLPVREIRLFGQVVQPVKVKKPSLKKTDESKDSTRSALNKPSGVRSSEASKPKEASVGEKRMTSSYQFPLEYRFEPGNEADGVTIHATLETVHQLQEHALEWGVPGFLEERIAHLIKSLPKEQRRKLIPAPDTARAISGRIPFGVGSFRSVLAAEFTRIAGELIREKDLDLSKIPESLQMNIRVSDVQGNLLVQSRDLHEVLEHVGEQASEKFALVEDSRWTRSGFTSWSFGDLPVQVQIESTLLDAASRSGKISAFPMLVDEGKSVGIRLSTSLFQAEMNIRRAVVRLFRHSVNRELLHQASWMPGFNEMKVQADHFVKTTRTPFVETICDLIAHTALNPEGFPALADMPSLLNRVPRNQQEYERLVKLGKGRISVVVQELPQPLSQLWKAYHAAIKALNSLCTKGTQRHAANDLASRLTFGTLQIKSFGNVTSPKGGLSANGTPKNSGEEKDISSRVALYEPFQPIVDDLDEQIRRLTPPDFLLQTSWKYVHHFARYFRGIEARVQSLSGTNSGTRIALTRGMEQIRELKHFQDEYERLHRDFELRGVESEELEAYRWAIEEYRVSLFAQKLGTSMSVSAKRLEKMLEAF
ncbi:MAG: DUF3418 domain-containing protein [Planctomycetaceae bacterium]|nr:DUF3418 domain-containing protein [Planctomycetaceae bacterium]